MQPDPSDQIANDWFRRGRVDIPPSDVDEPTAKPFVGADGGAHGGEPPQNPATQLDRAIRDAFARSPKRL